MQVSKIFSTESPSTRSSLLTKKRVWKLKRALERRWKAYVRPKLGAVQSPQLWKYGGNIASEKNETRKCVVSSIIQPWTVDFVKIWHAGALLVYQFNPRTTRAMSGGLNYFQCLSIATFPSLFSLVQLIFISRTFRQMILLIRYAKI